MYGNLTIKISWFLCHLINCVVSSHLICDVPHRIGEEVPGAIYVEALLNQVDAF